MHKFLQEHIIRRTYANIKKNCAILDNFTTYIYIYTIKTIQSKSIREISKIINKVHSNFECCNRSAMINDKTRDNANEKN